ncbi:hypothetical protein Atai01_46650 [Amycolatopsis taiwanensis]|uniref:Uncharacterized protein n=1 Tax=Amycolatopsis taiwanensis TaxID=342230 RepID=A0A9W6VJ20_9PSEU|nr:hypothetical protein Atai01_46650 [Amycolatopsis taiwanensis]
MLTARLARPTQPAALTVRSTSIAVLVGCPVVVGSVSITGDGAGGFRQGHAEFVQPASMAEVMGGRLGC